MSGGSCGGATRVAKLWVAAAALLLGGLVALPPLAARAAVGDVALISRGAVGAPASDGASGTGVAVSASGRFIAFESKATNLAPGAQPGKTNIYLRDTNTGTTTLISRASGLDGAGADGDSAAPAVSPAGRYVAFESVARNLSPDAGPARNVFVRDTSANTTALVSRASNGTPANGDSFHPSVSENGTYIAFASKATNLTSDGNHTVENVYRRNMDTGEVVLASSLVLGSLIVPGDGDSYDPTITKDGQRLAFTSSAHNLSTKAKAFTNIFVTVIQPRSIFVVSLPTGNFLTQAPADGDSSDGVISADGGYVAFVSRGTDFVDKSIQTPTIAQVFRRNLSSSETDLVSRATGSDGLPGFADSLHPSISGDGRYIAFESAAGNLSPDDKAGSDAFIRSMDTSTTALESRQSGSAGAPADGPSYAPVLSRDGRILAFSSDAANLSADENQATPVRNVFAREVPVTAPPAPPPVQLSNGDHSGHGGHDPNAHAGHTAAEHAGHTAAEHAGHLTANGAPAQTLFGPPVQNVDRLFVLSQVHGDANVIVTATIKLPGLGRASTVYRCKPFSGKGVTAHKLNRVHLRFSKRAVAAVKRAIRRGKRVRVRVVAEAQAATGGPWGYARLVIRLIATR